MSRRRGDGRYRLSSRTELFKGWIGYLTGFTLVACIVLGGATRNGSPGDVIVQFISIILLVSALREIIVSGSMRRLRWPLIFTGAIAIVPVIQLLPLPLDVWKHLPGRALISETYMQIGRVQPASPITVSPTATWLSLLALLPPIAVFLGFLTLGKRARRNISLIVIAFGIVSAILGLLQISQGPRSALRFYDITNTSEAVGFFANRNHFAALLYVSALFIAAHFFEAIIAVGLQSRNRRMHFNTVVPLIFWLAALVIALSGEMMARSRAGLILTALALLAATGLGKGDARSKALRPGTGKSILTVTAAALIFFVPLALSRILDRFGPDLNSDARIAFARNTISAAIAYMPLGSGIGTFVPVYQLFEKTPDIGLTYANHAHNDLLEIWLETGVLGLVLVSAFCAWVIHRATALWCDGSGDESGIDLSLRRVASVAVLLLLAHSLVDYPLRTTAMMAIAAVAVGFMITPIPRHRGPDTTNRAGSQLPPAP